ncbi:hypothetical protein [Flavobacterium bomense]|nr:hypothetical protein [Flavobacterium bomense]
MAGEESGTWLLELIFKGGPVGQLLGDGGLANAPSPSDRAQQQMRIVGAKNALIEHVFMPRGPQYPSRYNLFYKAK